MGKALVVMGLLALTGCQSSNLCWDKPIRPSQQALAALTDADVQDILEHNEKGAALCGWKV